MRLTVLGSGTLVPHPERGTPGFLVTAGEKNREEKLLFDGGSGTLYRLARAGEDWREISNLFYTHYHPDHTLDLVSFLFACNYAPGAERKTPLRVYGPAGLKEFYRRVSRAWPSVVPIKYSLELRELEPGAVVEGKGGWRVEPARMDHGDSGGLAYRISCEGKALTLSGDTQYCGELVRLARGADLLVCECSADESRRVEGHLNPEGVARVARESGVARVLLTHVYPPLDPEIIAGQCAALCAAQVSAAADLENYDI